MQNLLSKVLERIHFLLLSMAEQEDDLVDAQEEKLIDRLFSEWESTPFQSEDQDYRKRARKRFDDFVENDYPLSTQRDTLEFLGLHLSRGNMFALLDDLIEVANIDEEFSEREEGFMSAIQHAWDLGEGDRENAPPVDRNLRSGHFCNAFRLKRETALSDLLRQTFQVDALSPLIKPLEQETSSFCFTENHGDGHIVEKNFAPRLEKILRDVCECLNIKEEFSFYVTNHPLQGAWIWGGISSYGKNFITLTSELIASLSDEQLRFVIGHEIGHWIFNINDVTALIGQAYDGEERIPSVSMHNLLATWKKCAELSADRVGLLCCGSLDVASSTLFRVSTGLDPECMGFNLDDYLGNLDENLSPQEMDVFRQESHPPLPVRMKALAIFAESELYKSWVEEKILLPMDDELTARMNSIVELIDYTSNDPMHFNRLLAITLGGFYLASVDGEIADEEVTRIREILYKYVMHPDPIIEYAWNLVKGDEDVPSLLRGLLVDLVSHDDEEKYDMMNTLIEVALSDGVLHRNETQALMDIASFLGLDRELLLRVLAAQLGHGFFFEKQVPVQVHEVLDRPSPFYLGELEERINQAQSPNIDLESISQLSQDADPHVRLSVFFNESISEETRLALLDSPTLNQALQELQEQTSEDEEG